MTAVVKEEGLIVFVDNLGDGASGKTIADIFMKYGKLVQVMVSRCKPWIAYVHFEDKEDAREAIRCLDLTWASIEYINGKQVKVSLSKENCSNDWKSTEVYVSGLGDCPDQQKITGTFRIFGNLKHVWVNRSEEAFVIFGDVKGALGAVRCLDGTKLSGRRIKVQLASEASGLATKVCVDGLGEGAYVKELTELFEEYGRIKHVWIDYHQPGQAYIFFEDEDDARRSITSLDKSWINGKRVRVASSMTECRWSIWKQDSETEVSVPEHKDHPERSCQSSNSSIGSLISSHNNNNSNSNTTAINNNSISINKSTATILNTTGSTSSTFSSSSDEQDGWRSDERERNDRLTRKRKHLAEEDKEELSERLLKIKMLVNLAEVQLHQFIKDRLGREQREN